MLTLINICYNLKSVGIIPLKNFFQNKGDRNMGNKKTKLGIPNGLLAAFIFVGGMWSSVVLVAFLIYTAFMEDDEFVKVSARRAAIITFGYEAVSYALGLFTRIPYIFTNDLGGYATVFGKIDSVLDIAFTVIMLFFAVTALLNQDVKSSVVDKAAAAKKVCPKCGNTVAANAAFCNKCGEKM